MDVTLGILFFPKTTANKVRAGLQPRAKRKRNAEVTLR
jgi:hypothetical protein